MSEIIQDRGVKPISERLSGLRIAFGSCGGIGCVENIKNIRELRRHGAEVFPFVTPSVSEFISPMTLEWASGHSVISHQGAEVAYLEAFDAVVVAPMTLNSLVKAGLGLSDNAVLLLIAAQLGAKRPLLIVPTMNESLWGHPAREKSVSQLKQWGATVFAQGLEEGRLKMPAPAALAEKLIEIVKVS